MDPKDPDDDSGPPYKRMARELRDAILSQEFRPGDRLPSGPALASKFGVARDTARNAIRVLRDEGLVVSRQGSGVFVREQSEASAGGEWTRLLVGMRDPEAQADPANAR